MEDTFEKKLHLGGIRFISIISLVSLKSALLQEKQHYFHF